MDLPPRCGVEIRALPHLGTGGLPVPGYVATSCSPYPSPLLRAKPTSASSVPGPQLKEDMVPAPREEEMMAWPAM